MLLHDVSADESAVRAVQSMKVVVMMNHNFAERIQSVPVVHGVRSVDEVPLQSQAAVAVQYRVTAFHLIIYKVFTNEDRCRF